MASAILRVKGAATGGHFLPAPLLPFADEGAVSAQMRVERLIDQAEHAAPPQARRETPGQIALSWAATVLLAATGAAFLASPDAACTAHCWLELLQRL